MDKDTHRGGNHRVMLKGGGHPKKPKRLGVDTAPRGPALLTSQEPLRCSGPRGPGMVNDSY